MASSPKLWIILLFSVCLPCRLLVHSKDFSWKEFMERHYLSPNREFSVYTCDVLMKQKEAPKDKNPHIFIYIPWYKIEHICVKGTWNDRYRNAYVWTRNTLKVLKCYHEKSENVYKESRGYNHIQFHCNMDGYVDSIESLNLTEPILY
ncbi:epididymal secretory protein E3-beta [Oryctolagus cuniculus]|uniref:Ribonuclease A M1 n=1 Tax=Oryctolagus cuniculus TaxID=9986 RepID=G1TMG1_RABIT|nr:epididymal secretory protein E3-beta [Oryctolagus cuniculus]CDG32074.1 TPA: ribonuclease A M1 [Oryctolagus cuniculus]